MKVCIDVQSAVSQPAGVGRYTRLLAQHLGPTAAAGDTLRLFYFDFRRRGTPWATPGAQPTPVRWVPGRGVQFAWKKLNWPPFDWFAGRADLYHFPNFILPPLSRGRSIVTIHDLSFLRFPQYTEDRNCRFMSSRIADTAARADAILTVSRFSADEVRELLHVPPDRVFAIHPGVASHFVAPAPEQQKAVLQRLGLGRPYLLSVGTVEPRKNYPFLIELFERLTDFDGDLVLAGGLGWKVDPILRRIADSPRRTRIRHIPYADDAVLPALYAGASLFVMTSFYEGFGFPPLEAMACGTPVVSSAGGSLREVLGSGAVIVEGFDPEAWVAALRKMLSDSERRREWVAAGLRTAAQYTWTETARKTWEVYRKVAG